MDDLFILVSNGNHFFINMCITNLYVIVMIVYLKE
jgi:hypothetical protein